MEQLKALIEKAKSDKELMAKLDALGAKDAGDDEIIALAKEYGFTVTADEIGKLKNEVADSAGSNEITEDELEAVAGGWSENRYDPNTCKNMTKRKYECIGFLGGCWCDHFRRVYSHGKTFRDREPSVFNHECTKGAFPKYKGYQNGEHEKR